MSSIAVNMMVLNGASVLRRCLLPLKDVVSEVVVVDTGSTDGTLEVLTKICLEIGTELRYVSLNTHSDDDFFTDEPASFRTTMPGPFTGRRIPRDWSAVRNRAVALTSADYVLKLDADDEPISPPENWVKIVKVLESSPEISCVSVPYEICDGGKIVRLEAYARMFRREGLVWKGVCHEYAAGQSPKSTLYSLSGLRVRDWRDSIGEGARIAHRNLKVLLHAWEHGERKTISASEDLQDDLIFRFTLAHEAVEVFPDIARTFLDQVVSRLDPGDKGMWSDCYYHLGRVAEILESYSEARDVYAAADEKSPNLQALLRLYALEDKLGNVDGCRVLRGKIFERVSGGNTPLNCDLRLLARILGKGASR